MYIHKITSLCAAFIMVFSSCNDRNTVSRTDYDDLKKEYEDLKDRHSKTRENYVAQAGEMNEILTELSAITGRTNSLRLDVENGTARITEAEQIHVNIDEIRKKIDALERLSSNDKVNRALVENLRKTLEDKEKEISALKDEILRKDETIKRQGKTIADQEGTIDRQKETISLQEEELRKKIAEQARMLLDAGKSFEALADASPEVSWKRNKRRVNDWTLEMYNKALTYYLDAQDSGNAEAESLIERVREKIRNLSL